MVTISSIILTSNCYPILCGVDFDECKFGESDCSENAACKNLDGSFDCICSDGFIGDGRVCYSEGMSDEYYVRF